MVAEPLAEGGQAGEDGGVGDALDLQPVTVHVVEEDQEGLVGDVRHLHLLHRPGLLAEEHVVEVGEGGGEDAPVGRHPRPLHQEGDVGGQAGGGQQEVGQVSRHPGFAAAL